MNSFQHYFMSNPRQLGESVRRATLTDDLRPALCVLVSNSLQRSDLGLLGRKSDGSSAVPEHPQSQVRTIQSSLLRMKPAGASVSARIVGLDPLPVKSVNTCSGLPLHFDVNHSRAKNHRGQPHMARLPRVSYYFDGGGVGIASSGLPIDESPDAGSNACLPSGGLGRFEVRYWQSPCRPYK
jgi:hypothetical protein